MSSFLLHSLNFLIPKKCVNCKLISTNYICTQCSKNLIEYQPECFVSRIRSDKWDIMPEHKISTSVEKIYYFYEYDKIIHNLITSIKYLFHKCQIEQVISLIFNAKEFQNIDQTKIDLITFVPISKKRQNWRGFNQSKIIAEELAKILEKPYCSLLIKQKNTTAQIDLDRERRMTNLKNSFCIKQELPIKLSEQSILLIDDICTTGSTLEECSKVIKENYPGLKVYGLCLARGKKV